MAYLTLKHLCSITTLWSMWPYSTCTHTTVFVHWKPWMTRLPFLSCLPLNRWVMAASDTSRKSINMRTGIVSGLISGYQQLKYDVHLTKLHCQIYQPLKHACYTEFFIITQQAFGVFGNTESESKRAEGRKDRWQAEESRIAAACWTQKTNLLSVSRINSYTEFLNSVL